MYNAIIYFQIFVNVQIIGLRLIEPHHVKTCLRGFRPAKNSNQSAQLRRLAIYRALKFWIQQVYALYYLDSEQNRRWSDCADAQADLCLCCFAYGRKRFSHDTAQLIISNAAHLDCICDVRTCRRYTLPSQHAHIGSLAAKGRQSGKSAFWRHADGPIENLFVCSGLRRFQHFSVISRRCLAATGSSMLIFIVLPHWSTWHDTTPSHIILILGRPVLALPRTSECQARSS